MRLGDGWLDRLHDRIVLSDIVRRKVALTRRGTEHIGLCPFHSEKTPSFHVVDDKGFYHCFGCQAHGDAISFLMETEGLEFMDAVRQLADEAGLELPERTQRPADMVKTDLSGHAVMAMARDWFVGTLFTPKGRDALDYLHGRGLDDDTINHFGLGFAPKNDDELRRHLLENNATQDQLTSLGLFRSFDNDPSKLYGFFRDRIMFPITDRRGNVIAFGGRYMGDAKSDHVGKYINSQQTALFDKGASLYNLHNARATIRDANQIIIVEGYMDVIAMWRAGFPACVAPLGTALGDRQLEQIWRMHPEPVICFDGDAAGMRAANRVADIALRVMRTGQTLRFARMPDGMDPDDILAQHGKAGLQRILASPRPLHMMIWQSLLEAHPTNTPEQRAKLTKAIDQLCRQIADQEISREYRKELRNLVFQHARSQNPARKAGQGAPKGAYKIQDQDLILDNIAKLQHRNIKSILAVLIRHPQCIEYYMEKLSQISPNPPLDKLVEMLIDMAVDNEQNLNFQTVSEQAEQLGIMSLLGDVMSDDILRTTLAAAPDSTEDDAKIFLEQTWAGLAQGQLQGTLQEWFWDDKSDDDRVNRLLDEAEAQNRILEKQFLKLYE
ncbi:MAG: DNA primase [Pseudomonadota bacterium]